jgi:hypothetical protein
METVFFNELEKEYSELIETGKIQIVEDVKKFTSKQFSYKYPLYFSGNIRSKIVVVNFNFKKKYLYNENQPADFNSYRHICQTLGKVFVEANIAEELESDFSADIRLFNYIKPFQVFRFDNDSLPKNLQKLTDEKLELDMVPYLSPDFSEKDFMTSYKVCKPFIDRILSGIIAYPRQYVIFMGDCFNRILSEYIEESETFKFLLTSPNQPNQKFVAQFTRIIFSYNGKRVIAGIADSFCDENLDEVMLEKFGRESVAILNRGLLLANPLWKS